MKMAMVGPLIVLPRDSNADTAKFTNMRIATFGQSSIFGQSKAYSGVGKLAIANYRLGFKNLDLYFTVDQLAAIA